MNMNRAYREPILATIYTIVGWLTFLVGILGMLAASAAAVSESSAFVPLFMCIGVIFIALIILGVGQMFSLIGRTAYCVESINEQVVLAVNQSRTLSAQPQVELVAETPPQASMPDVRSGSVNCPECNKAILREALRIGDNGLTKCPHCGGYFNVLWE